MKIYHFSLQSSGKILKYLQRYFVQKAIALFRLTTPSLSDDWTIQ